MFLFLLGLNIIYVIAELSYNAYLLNDLSSPYPDIELLELLGRLLSSFGATFIFYKLISSLNIKNKQKIAAFILATLIVYPSVFIGQKELVNFLANNTSVEEREKYADLLILKHGWANGSLSVNSLPVYNDSVESKVFLNVFGVLNSNNDSLLNSFSENRRAVLENSFGKDMLDDIDSSYKEDYKKLERVLNNLYGEYSMFVKHEYRDKISKEKIKAADYYEELKNREGSIYRQQYYQLRNQYDKSEAFVKQYVENAFGRKYLVGIADSKNFDSLKSADLEYQKVQKSFIDKFKDYDLDVSSFKVYEFSDFCSMNRGGKGIEYYAYKDVDGKQDFKKFLGWNNHLAKKYKIVCNVGNLEAEYNRIMKLVDNAFYEKFGLASYDYNSVEELVSDKHYVRWVASSVLGKEISHDIRYDSKNNFVEDYVYAVNKLMEKEIQDVFIEKYGFNIPLDLESPKEFIRNNNVKNYLIDSYGVFFIDKFEFGLSVEEYAKDLAYDMLVYKVNEFEKSDFSGEVGVNAVKAMIVPPVALFLSAFFGLINIVILFKSVFGVLSKNHKVKKGVNIISLILVVAIFIAPLYFDFVFSNEGNYLLIEEALVNNNIAAPYLIKWLLNIEPLLFEIGYLVMSLL